MTTQPSSSYRVVRFGAYQCEFHAGELHKSGIKVKLTDQPFRLLAFLIERRGEIVTRQELRERLWPNDAYGEFDDGLNTAVNRLRAALDDSADNPRFIETIPRRGYRFIAPIEAEPLVSGPATQTTTPATQVPPGSLRPVPVQSAPPVPPAHPLSALMPLGRRLGFSAGLAATLIVACAAAVWWHIRARTVPSGEPRIRSIAVLPFANFSGDVNQDFLAEGMTDELTTELTQLGSLRVTSRSSVMAYSNRAEPIRHIREELGVDAVVEGSVARVGQNVRVDAHLVETSDDRQIWAQTFTEKEQDILALEDDITRAVAERIQVAIDPDVQERLLTSRPVVADAYEAYLRGNTFMEQHSDADLMKSLDYYKQAIALDPTLAEAYAAEAQAYCYLGDYSVLPDRVVWPQAEMAAEHSIALDDTIGKAHAARAFALWRSEWNWEAADREFRRALFLTPNDADTHHLYGVFLATEGDFAGAERQLQTARQLDPLSLIVRTNMGWLRYYQHDYVGAIADYQEVLRKNPKFIPAQNKLWIAYALHGDAQRAGAQLDALFRSYDHPGLVDRIVATERSDDPAAYLRADVLAYANSGYLSSYEQARFFAVAGENEKAIESLQTAISNRNSWMVYAGIEPAFDPLRSSPQFNQLLAAVGLKPKSSHK